MREGRAPTRLRAQRYGGAAYSVRPAITRVVRDTTKGFGHLAQAGREDFMVESLVVDESRPYHGRFSAATVATARERFAKYRAQQAGQSPAG